MWRKQAFILHLTMPLQMGVSSETFLHRKLPKYVSGTFADYIRGVGNCVKPAGQMRIQSLVKVYEGAFGEISL